jgi:hypothetical protein
MLNNTQLPNGLIARVAIQCEHPVTHQTGSFLFSGDTHRNADSVHSPCLPDLYELHQWCLGNYWVSVGSGYVYTPAKEACNCDACRNGDGH